MEGKGVVRGEVKKEEGTKGNEPESRQLRATKGSTLASGDRSEDEAEKDD